jgi:hypothetical protein
LARNVEISALPVRAGAPIDPGTLAATEANLFLSTVDDKGRLALRGPAATMGWTPGQELWLSRPDGGLLLTQLPHAHRVDEFAVMLDSRFRVLLPYFIRVHNNWAPGVRLVVLAAPLEGVLAALPVARVAAAVLGAP